MADALSGFLGVLRSFTAVVAAGQSMNGLTMTARGQSRWVTDKLVNECVLGRLVLFLC